VKIGLYQ